MHFAYRFRKRIFQEKYLPYGMMDILENRQKFSWENVRIGNFKKNKTKLKVKSSKTLT